MKDFFIKSIPHIVAIVIFLAVSNMMFSPIHSGLSLKQGDITHYYGMSKELKDYLALEDERIKWSNNMFGGMPTYQTTRVNDGNMVGFIYKVMTFNLPRPIAVLFMAMIGFYILCLCMKIDPWLGIAGGLAFGLSTMFVLYLGAGHTSKMNALSLIPPVLGGVILTLKGKHLKGALVTSLFLALHLYSNHLQVTYYLLFLLLFSGIAIGVGMIINGEVKKFIKSSIVLVAAGLIGVLPSMSNLMLTNEYSDYTTRGKSELTINPDGSQMEEEKLEATLDPDYILEYNLGKGELLSILIPDVKGGQSGYLGNKTDAFNGVSTQNKNIIKQLPVSSYWGSQAFTGGAIYFGAVMFLLFVVGFVVAKDHLKWGLLAMALLTLALALKEGALVEAFIRNVPLFDKFRDSKMILMILQVIIPLVALMGINDLIKDPERRLKLRIPAFIGGGAVVLVMIIITLAPTSLFDFHSLGDEQGLSKCTRTKWR